MTSHARPFVTVALPVYNGERYLELALGSILGQTYTNFELLICDNASTDRTAAICRQCEARDSRIRYHRNAINIGAARNYDLTIRMAAGELYQMAADDDMFEPQCLEKCVAALESDTDAIQAHTSVRMIGPEGETLCLVENELPLAASPRPSDRFAAILFEDIHCQAVFGTFRTAVLRSVRTFGDYHDDVGQGSSFLEVVHRVQPHGGALRRGPG